MEVVRHQLDEHKEAEYGLIDIDYQEDGEEDEEYEGSLATPISASLPREMAIWKFHNHPESAAGLSDTKLSPNTPLVGLADRQAEKFTVYAGQVREIIDRACFDPKDLPGPADGPADTESPKVARSINEGRAYLHADATGLSDNEAQFHPEPSNNVYDDSGYTLSLISPAKGNYFTAISRQQDNDETAYNIGYMPYAVDTENECDPFSLGPAVSWAPYFVQGAPHSGRWRMTRSLRGGSLQAKMPFVRCLVDTDKPLAFPSHGDEHEALPSFRCPLQQPSDGNGERLAWESTPSRCITITEFANATGQYRGWSKINIGLHMMESHLKRNDIEMAGTVYASVIDFLVRHVRDLGLLAQCEAPISDIPIATQDKRMFWSRIDKLSHSLLKEQALRVGHAQKGQLESIPKKLSVTETQLTGQPFHQPGVQPDRWWPLGRDIDDEWIELTREHFWNGDSGSANFIMDMDTDSGDGTPQTSPSPASTPQSSREQTQDKKDSRRPLNIISEYTLGRIIKVVGRLRLELNGEDNLWTANGSSGAFITRDRLRDLYDLAIRCVDEVNALDLHQDAAPKSRCFAWDWLRPSGHQYKHPLEEYGA